MAKKPTFPNKTFTHKNPLTGESYQIGDAGKHFQLTPEKLKAVVADQAAWAERSQSPYVGLTPQMSIVNRARRELPDWYEGLQQVELALATAKRGKKELKAKRDHFLGLIAECFGILGQYDEAIALSPRGYKVQRKEWKALQKAVAKADGCDCSIEDHPFLASKERVHAHVFNPATGQMTPIVACNVCNELSVKTISPELAKQRDIRAKAAGIAQGKAHDVAHKDLTTAGLTAEKVFRLRQ
jgi:hypothetical protein